MRDLPNEIWWLIASYLPDREVTLLYSVNRAIFKISMDLRYQEVHLSTHPGVAVLSYGGKDIRLFRNPVLASRPKIVRLYCCFNNHKVKKKSFLKALCRPFVDPKKQRKHYLVKLIEAVVAITPQLTGVTTLDISVCRCPPTDPDDSYYLIMERLIPPIWQNLRNQIRFCKVNCAVKDLEVLLPNSSLQISSLEALSLEANEPGPNGTEITEAVNKTVVPFLNNHLTTLRTISVRIAKHDYSLVLPCLRNMQSLQHLHIFIPLEATPFAGRDVLAAQQANLTSLGLYYINHIGNQKDSSFYQDWCSIKLPHLSELTLCLPWILFCPQFADYIHQFASSLVSLTIMHCPDFKHEDIEQFCSRLVNFRSLRTLSLSIYGMSPANLALFARALPHLRSLALHFHYICPDKDIQIFDPAQLVSSYRNELEPNAQIFSDWKLESLDILPDGIWMLNLGGDGMQGFDNRMSIIKPLLGYLPNVQEICQISRKEHFDYYRQREARFGLPS